MKNSEVYNKIKLIEDIKPNKRWVNKNRSVLLSAIKKTQTKDIKENLFIITVKSIKYYVGFVLDKITPYRTIEMFGRPAVVSMAGVVILISGLSVMYAANDTVPGKILYPVKIANENIRLSLVDDTANKARLEIDFAGRRIGEINKLISEKNSNLQTFDSNISKTTTDLKNKISTVKNHLAELKKTDSGIALNTAKDIDKKISEYSLALKNIDYAPAQKEIGEVMTQVEEVGNKTLEVMIAKNNENTDAINDLDIVEKLNSKIALIENDGVKDSSTEQIFIEAKELVNKGDFTAALVKIEEGQDIIKKIKEEMKKQAEVVEIKDTNTEPVEVENVEVVNEQK